MCLVGRHCATKGFLGHIAKAMRRFAVLDLCLTIHGIGRQVKDASLFRQSLQQQNYSGSTEKRRLYSLYVDGMHGTLQLEYARCLFVSMQWLHVSLKEQIM